MDETAFLELEIVRGRLQAVVDEAGATLMRTAFSNIVREAKDFACALMTPDGHTVVQSSQSIPAFLGTMAHTVGAVLEKFAPDSWRPGDVVGTNDPWLGTGHLFDLTVVAPVFVDDELVAFAAVVAHLPDVGGRAPGTGATQIFEEGLRIPLVRLATADGLDPIVAAIVAANVRVPDEVLGDINAMLNSAEVIARRLSALCDEISVVTFHDACDELEARTEDFMRTAVRSVPDGTYTAEISSDGFAGIPFTLVLTASVRGDEITLDFTGSSDQVSASINSSLSFSRAYAIYAVKCLLAPDLPLNEGILRPITVVAAEGSIVNSKFPAAGEARSSVSHFIPTLVYSALADPLPDRIIAQSGAPRPLVRLLGSGADGLFSATVIAAGGLGARASKDGIACVAFPTNTETIPVEMIEAMSPLRFEEKQLLTDSGGPGQFRGGLAQRISVRSLTDGVVAGVRAQWLTRRPAGAFGGGHGAVALVELNGVRISELGSAIKLQSGDVISVESPGGGGYGPPELRDLALVEADVAAGYVSEDQAQQAYASRSRTEQRKGATANAAPVAPA